MKLMTNLEWFDLLLRNDYERVISLPKTMQAGVDLLVKKFDQTVEESLSQMHPGDRDDYAGMAEDHSRELSEEYPLLMRRALLMVTYSKLEYSMHRLCEAAFFDKKSVTPNPERKYLGQSETYIKTELGVTDVALEPDWTCANSIRDIRNNLAHADGYVKGDQSELSIRTFIGANPELEIRIDDNDVLVVGEKTVELIASRSQEFVASLLQRIRELPDA